MQIYRPSPFRTLVYKTMGVAVRLLNGHSQRKAFEPGWVDVSQLRLALPRLERPFHGYRLVQISDIHLGTWVDRYRLEQLAAMANQQRPDLVAITGDFVNLEAERYAEDLVKALGGLRARDGLVAVLGNHDHWTNPRVIRQVLRDSGIRDLSNSVYTLERGGAQLHVAGVDDVIVGMADLERVLARLPESGAAILLAHEPDYADQSAASGRFDLQLSGHTHGGQVVLPWLGAPVLPRRGRKYPQGLYQVNGMALYTNRGVGTTTLQLRLNCRPEVAVFTLVTGE